MSRTSRQNTDAFVLRLVDEGRLPASSPHDCPYLDDRQASEEGFMIESLRPATYQALMDRGFRRSGNVFYRPVCESCRACIQLRVPTDRFQRSRSQRRVWRRNEDLTLRQGVPVLTDEKFELYSRYLEAQHPNSRQTGDREGMREFLYNSSVHTIEVTYHDADERLVAVSLLDASATSLSSVYHYFDPGERRRSLGVFSVLAEIELARRNGIPWYYLGYWIQGSATMDYKANYRPHELLIDGRWTQPDAEHRGDTE